MYFLRGGINCYGFVIRLGFIIQKIAIFLFFHVWWSEKGEKERKKERRKERKRELYLWPIKLIDVIFFLV